MSYIARDQCCNANANRGRCSSRSGTDNINHGGCNNFESTPNHIAALNNTAANDVLSIRDKIEITSNRADGKITDI